MGGLAGLAGGLESGASHRSPRRWRADGGVIGSSHGGWWGVLHLVFWSAEGKTRVPINGIGTMRAGEGEHADGGWRGMGAAEGCPALAGRGEIVGLLPGPALRSSPGYHITGLRPFEEANISCGRKAGDMSQHGPTETSAS